MKNGLVIWNVVLTLLTGFLLINYFSKPSGKSVDVPVIKSADSVTAGKDFRIAYFEMDSVEAHYVMVKDVKADISGKEAEFNANVEKLDQIYKTRYNELVKKDMTAEEEEKAKIELQTLGEKLKNDRVTFEQDYQDFVARKNLAVKKNIETYLKDFTIGKNYSYIISYEPGLYYYHDTAYNITPELIKGLNATYKKEPAKAK